jgi:hypothetical protein
MTGAADVDRTRRRVDVALLVGVFISALNVASAAAAGTAPVSPWQPVAFPSQLHPGAMLLLTTGSVMVQDQGPISAGGATGSR